MASLSRGRLTGSSHDEVDTKTSLGIDPLKSLTSDWPDEIRLLDVTHGPFSVLHLNWCLVGLDSHDSSMTGPLE